MLYITRNLIGVPNISLKITQTIFYVISIFFNCIITSKLYTRIIDK